MNSDLTPDIVEVHRVFATDQAIDVLRFAYDVVRRGQACALITLVEINGGSARSLGAHMAVTADGGYCGTVSGGCVEGVAAQEAVMAIAAGCDRTLRLGKGSAYFDIELPCGGGIKLAIHVIRQSQALEAVLNAHDARQSVSLIYDPDKQQLRLTESHAETGWNQGDFYTVYPPALRILLFSQGLEGVVLQQVATALNIETLRDIRTVSLADIDKHTAIILLHHDIDKEMPVLHTALSSQAFYIGCLGSRHTHSLRSAQLVKDGFSTAQIERISAPVGLFGPVRDARSLAVSVLADVMSQKLAGHNHHDAADD